MSTSERSGLFHAAFPLDTSNTPPDSQSSNASTASLRSLRWKTLVLGFEARTRVAKVWRDFNVPAKNGLEGLRVNAMTMVTHDDRALRQRQAALKVFPKMFFEHGVHGDNALPVTLGMTHRNGSGTEVEVVPIEGDEF